MQSAIFLWTVISGAAALVFSGFLTMRVLSLADGSKKMTEIADAIKEGANAYLVRQYKVVAIVAAVFFLFLGYFISWLAAVGFLFGAITSPPPGYIGRAVAVRATGRTAEAARGGIPPALSGAFRAGSVTGL